MSAPTTGPLWGLFRNIEKGVRMKIDLKLFNSKLGHRFFLVFVCSTLIPIIALSAISFRGVVRQLAEQTHHRLQQAAKSQGMAIYDRLISLESDLELVASLPAEELSQAMAEQKFAERLRHRFDAISRHPAGSGEIVLFGEARRGPAIGETEIHHLNFGKTMLRIRARESGPPRIELVRLVSTENPAAGVVMGAANAAYLFGIGHEKSLPPMTDLCILDADRQILINTSRISDAVVSASFRGHHDEASRRMEFSEGSNTYLASYWDLFLKANFLVPSWRVALIQTESAVLQPVRSFRFNFFFIILLAFWLVLLLSSFFIRRSFLPLVKIKAGTRQIAEGDFKARVAVSSGDEFEELADAFNQMAGQLDRQFETLNTLSEIDRAVLSCRETHGIIESLMARLPAFVGCDDMHVAMPVARDDTKVHGYLKDAETGETVMQPFSVRAGDCRRFSPVADLDVRSAAEIDCPGLTAPLEARGAEWFLLLPLWIENTLHGVIAMGYRIRPQLKKAYSPPLRQVANQVAVALANARLTEELQRAEEALKAANQELEAKVAERTRELTETNETLQAEVLRRRETEEELIVARRAAETANRTKSEFLAGMSHELRTPLNHIIGFTELIIDGHLGELTPDQAEYLGDVHHSSLHLLALINDILDLSKVEAGKLELDRSDVLIRDLLEGALTMVSEKAMKHGITLQTDLDGVPDTISADARKLKQILYNLLSNAVKFTPDGGSVRLSGRLRAPETPGERSWVDIQVADSGIGLSPQELEKVFDPFEQAAGSGRLRHEGTGLGLPLTQRLVELHGGAIRGESGGPEKGACFSFSLPVDPD